MFWSKKKHHHGGDHHDKEKQLKDLKSVFPSLRRPNNDDSLFSIQFCVDNQYSALRIFIPAEFPNIRPVLQVDGPVSHPWLDQFKQVNGCEKLIHWTKNSSLVAVVEETIAMLSTGTNTNPTNQTIPNLNAQLSGVSPMPSRRDSFANRQNSNSYSPYPASAAASSPYSHFSNSNSDNFSSNTLPAQQQQQSPAHPSNYPAAVPLPSSTTGNTAHFSASAANVGAAPASAATSAAVLTGIGAPATVSRQTSDASFVDEMNSPGPKFSLPGLPDNFSELETLTDVQLERLLNDDVALQTHIEGLNLESVSSMQSLIQQMQESNMEAVSKNLALGEELNVLDRELNREKQTLKDAITDYENDVLSARIEYAVPAEKILKELKTVRDELDESSEEIGRSFVDGSKELPLFITEYLDHRIRYHTLCTKITALESNPA